MNREFFADTIGSIHVTGNLVRIDFLSVQPQQAEQAKQEGIKPSLTTRLIIPLDGFVSGFNLQEQVVRQLTKNGILVDGRTFSPQEETKNEPKDELKEKRTTKK